MPDSVGFGLSLFNYRDKFRGNNIMLTSRKTEQLSTFVSLKPTETHLVVSTHSCSISRNNHPIIITE